MKEALRPSPESETALYDDEITQPFRIVCERKPEVRREDSRKAQSRWIGTDPRSGAPQLRGHAA